MDKVGAFNSKEYKDFCKSKTIEIENSATKLHTGTGVVNRAIQTLKILKIANMEDNLCLTERENRTLNVMRITKHTGLKFTSFVLHHSLKPLTEQTKLMKTEKCLFQQITDRRYHLRYQKRRRGGIKPHHYGPYTK